MMVVILQVPTPYNRTFLTFVLKILTVALADSHFKFQISFDFKNTALTLPILALTSVSDSPCLPIILLRYAKVSTSSRTLLSSLFWFLLTTLHFWILFFYFGYWSLLIRKILLHWQHSSELISMYNIVQFSHLQNPNHPAEPKVSTAFHAHNQGI